MSREDRVDDSIQKDLHTILETVKSRVRLERLYLFGSFAYGHPSQDSDLDLCIVAETDQSKIEALRDIRTALFAKSKHPLDFVFFSPDEFKTRSQVRNSFEWQIEHKGQMIYGQP
jgi:predicted nucleotidyltransferase